MGWSPGYAVCYSNKDLFYQKRVITGDEQLQRTIKRDYGGLAIMRSERVGSRQLFISLAVAALVISGVIVWNVVRQPPEGPTSYMISMTDYQFSPAQMTWRAGQKVAITLDTIPNVV
jgi:hypothetical protein